jgi:hypothetical protein
MGLQLHIPDSVLQSLRLPEERMVRELLKELAIALYARDSYRSVKPGSWLVWRNTNLVSY